MILNITSFFNEIREIALYLATVLFLFCFPPAIHFFFEFKKERIKKHHKKADSKTDKKMIEVKGSSSGGSNEFNNTGKG